MKKTLIFILLNACIYVASGQAIEAAAALFKSRQFDSALVVARNIISHDTTLADAYIIAGRSLVAKGEFTAGAGYLEKAKTFTDAPLHVKAWAMCELGLCYFSKGDYPKAKASLLDCMELHATRNVNATASNYLLKLGLDTIYDSWSTKESKHFIFHFRDTSAITNTALFIQRKEAAYDSINSFFKSKLPKKIDYFVWSNSEQAGSLLNHPLAFSEPALCITHTEPKHTVGHEMTHSISYYSVKVVNSVRLISEGVCVYFDLSKKDNLSLLKQKNNFPIPVTDIWKNNSKLNDDIIYPLGGELVKRLIAAFGRDKFINLLADQSYDNAKKIYGEELDTLLQKLEEEIRQ
jgi:tetratricopeptide (TPR) repeat protein